MITRATFENVNVQAAAQKAKEAESIIRLSTDNLSGYEGHLELLSPEGAARTRCAMVTCRG